MCDINISKKFKMAAIKSAKPEVLIALSKVNISTWFERQDLCFLEWYKYNCTISANDRHRYQQEIQDSDRKTGIFNVWEHNGAIRTKDHHPYYRYLRWRRENQHKPEVIAKVEIST